MSYQLSNISTQYRKFSKGQYVDDVQFNEFLDFFEDQDRLSRVMLQGVGIVCGFVSLPVYTGNQISSIKLSQGIAITTDGDLMTLNNRSTAKKINDDPYTSELKTIAFDGNQYTHWKVYDNHKALYAPFHKSGQIKLWELVTSNEAKPGFQPLSAFSSLEDKYLLLYLESYEKEAKPCRGVDCDNHGLQQIRNLKVLVTDKRGIEHVLGRDNVAPHPVFLDLKGYDKQKRVILTPSLKMPGALKTAYSEVIEQSNLIAMFNNVDTVSEMLGVPLTDRNVFKKQLTDLSMQEVGFQYAYSALKDLTNAYSQIVRLVSKSFTKQMPCPRSFPKHVMLGKIVADTKFDDTRHVFYNSPLLDNEKMGYSRLITSINRFNELTKAFIDPIATGVNDIRITPSQDISLPGKKAIPFYYNITEQLLNTWDFDKTRVRVSNTNLSFNKELLSAYPHVQNPLSYNIDRKSFYRIEGHQGMDYDEATDVIRKIRNDEQLAFDVMAVSLEKLPDSKDLVKAYYDDYIAKHTGLEHYGGVKRGGTFVVIYRSENDKKVIADFALPYICCTPKSDVALSLPVSTICSNAAPISFRVIPPDGVVKAAVGDTSFRGVQNINGQYKFYPQYVDSQHQDKEIKFTVNEKPTNCTIKVLPFSNPDIRPVSFAYPEGASKKTVVTFNVSGENFKDYDYEWDFLGNESYIPLKPDANGNVEHDYYEIDAKKPLNVMMSGNGCSRKIVVPNWYVPPVVTDTKPEVIVTTENSTVYPEERVRFLATIRRINVKSYKWECDAPGAAIAEVGISEAFVTITQKEGNFKVSLTVTDVDNIVHTGHADITLRIRA